MKIDGSGQNHPRPAVSTGWKQRDPLLALLAVNAAWGGLLGIGFVVGAIALDLGHLRQLLTLSIDGAIALGLLTIGSVVTFASVVMGGAVMMISRDGDGPTSGKRKLARLVPVLATVSAKRRGRSGQAPLND